LIKSKNRHTDEHRYPEISKRLDSRLRTLKAQAGMTIFYEYWITLLLSSNSYTSAKAEELKKISAITASHMTCDGAKTDFGINFSKTETARNSAFFQTGKPNRRSTAPAAPKECPRAPFSENNGRKLLRRIILINPLPSERSLSRVPVPCALYRHILPAIFPLHPKNVE